MLLEDKFSLFFWIFPVSSRGTSETGAWGWSKHSSLRENPILDVHARDSTHLLTHSGLLGAWKEKPSASPTTCKVLESPKHVPSFWFPGDLNRIETCIHKRRVLAGVSPHPVSGKREVGGTNFQTTQALACGTSRNGPRLGCLSPDLELSFLLTTFPSFCCC